MMDSKAQHIAEIITPAAAALGYELLGCEIMPRGRGVVLRVYIDSPQGIGLQDCERVSRQASAMLDVEDPIQSHYSLEVSSPGWDRPLFTVAHYQKYLGQTIAVRLRYPLETRRNLRGEIKSVTTEHVVLRCGEQEFSVPFSAIQKGHLVVNDDDEA